MIKVEFAVRCLCASPYYCRYSQSSFYYLFLWLDPDPVIVSSPLVRISCTCVVALACEDRQKDHSSAIMFLNSWYNLFLILFAFFVSSVVLAFGLPAPDYCWLFNSCSLFDWFNLFARASCFFDFPDKCRPIIEFI